MLVSQDSLAQMVENPPVHQKVTGSICGWGNLLLFLSLTPFHSLSKCSGEKWKLNKTKKCFSPVDVMVLLPFLINTPALSPNQNTIWMSAWITISRIVILFYLKCLLPLTLKGFFFFFFRLTVHQMSEAAIYKIIFKWKYND